MMGERGGLGVSMPAAAFAVSEAIRAGEWDAFLNQLRREIVQRCIITDRTRVPRLPTPEPHQVWAWMNYPDMPSGGQWEIRGTGLIPDDEQQ